MSINMLMAGENLYEVQNKNGTFTSNYFKGKYLALNTNLNCFPIESCEYVTSLMPPPLIMFSEAATMKLTCHGHTNQ
jgi:hypothetical protein